MKKEPLAGDTCIGVVMLSLKKGFSLRGGGGGRLDVLTVVTI